MVGKDANRDLNKIGVGKMNGGVIFQSNALSVDWKCTCAIMHRRKTSLTLLTMRNTKQTRVKQ